MSGFVDPGLADDAGIIGDAGRSHPPIGAPDEGWSVEPVSRDERLVIVDTDPAAVRGDRRNFNPTGHHFGGDVIHVEVGRILLDPVTFAEA